jgi:hypothetical protein
MNIDNILTPELKQMLIKMQEDMYFQGKRDAIKALLETFQKMQIISEDNVTALLKGILDEDKMRGEG